eukprot:1001735-Prorocentrum_minimum.AAC.1
MTTHRIESFVHNLGAGGALRVGGGGEAALQVPHLRLQSGGGGAARRPLARRRVQLARQVRVALLGARGARLPNI